MKIILKVQFLCHKKQTRLVKRLLILNFILVVQKLLDDLLKDLKIHRDGMLLTVE